MRSKLKIIVPVVVIIVLIIVFIVLRQRKGIPQIIQTNGPEITTYVKGTFPIDVKLTKSDFNFPDSLPLLNVGVANTITLEEAKSYAKSFGINTEPQLLNDTIDGTVYFWSDNSSSLTIRPKSNQVRYIVNKSALTGTRLKEADLVNKASSYLLQRSLVSDTSSKTVYVSYQRNSGEGIDVTTIDQADFAYINFSVNAADYRIVTINPLSSPLKVRILPDGTIVEVDITRLPTITRGTVNYQIKNFDQFNASITQSKIVSLDDGNMVSPNTSTNPIKSVNVSSVELAYLMDSISSSTFKPIFIVKGIADIEGIGNNLSVYLYLPAFVGQ